MLIKACKCPDILGNSLKLFRSKINSTCTVVFCNLIWLFLVDKIIVGSYMGYLRIFNPRPVKPGDGVQAEDLLLEVQLREPVLQVEVGKFVL